MAKTNTKSKTSRPSKSPGKRLENYNNVSSNGDSLIHSPYKNFDESGNTSDSSVTGSLSNHSDSGSDLEQEEDDDPDEEDEEDIEQNADEDETSEESEHTQRTRIKRKSPSDIDDDDEEESDSSDDSDSSISSASSRIISKLGKPANKKDKKNTSIPKLDLSALREKLLASSTTKSESDNDSSDLSSLSDDDFDLTSRRESIVENSTDDNNEFPRSRLSSPPNQGQIKLVISDESSDEGDDFEDDSLLALLNEDQGETSESSLLDDEADNESFIEHREEQAIVNELQDENQFSDADKSSPSPTIEYPFPNNFSSKNDITLPGYISEDDFSQSEMSFSDDPFFMPKDSNNATARDLISSASKTKQDSDDDDSYLWSYFFTSDEEEGEEEDRLRTTGAEGNTNGNGIYYDYDTASGESTDEDTNLPPPSHKKVGSRATEILSSSSMASRPPILGSWIMTTERPYGIIDGLTTRTLSPPRIAVSDRQESRGWKGGKKRSLSHSSTGQFSSDSELSELALDEVIYTSDLEALENDDDDDDQWMKGRNSDVPLSAFRNRTLSLTPYNYADGYSAHRRLSNSNARRDRKREVVMTPVRSMKRQHKRQKRHKNKFVPGRIDGKMNFDAIEFGSTDLIDELVETGGLSPLFGGL